MYHKADYMHSKAYYMYYKACYKGQKANRGLTTVWLLEGLSILFNARLVLAGAVWELLRRVVPATRLPPHYVSEIQCLAGIGQRSKRRFALGEPPTGTTATLTRPSTQSPPL